MEYQIYEDDMWPYSYEDAVDEIPYGVQSIASGIFWGRNDLQEVYVTDGLTSLKRDVFEKCRNIRKLVLPNSIRRIDPYSVQICENLEEVVLGNQVEEIGASVFLGCNRLKSIQFPDSLRSLGAYAFSCCTCLQEVSIPNGVLSIGKNCFELCIDLHYVFVPASVRKIGTCAFSRCDEQLDLRVDPANPQFSAENGNLLSKDGCTLLCSPANRGCVSVSDTMIRCHLVEIRLAAGLQNAKNDGPIRKTCKTFAAKST